MNKKVFLILTLIACTCAAIFAQDASEAEAAGQAAAAGAGLSAGIKYLAAAIAVGLACIAGGIAVAKIGSSAMGAMSENPELSGKALPFVGLAEGICLWGMLVAVLILIL